MTHILRIIGKTCLPVDLYSTLDLLMVVEDGEKSCPRARGVTFSVINFIVGFLDNDIHCIRL